MFKRNTLKHLVMAVALAGSAAAAIPSLAGVSTQQLAQDAIAPVFPGASPVRVAPHGAGNWDARATARSQILAVFPGKAGAEHYAATTIESGATCRISGQQIVQGVITGYAQASC